MECPISQSTANLKYDKANIKKILYEISNERERLKNKFGKSFSIELENKKEMIEFISSFLDFHLENNDILHTPLKLKTLNEDVVGDLYIMYCHILCHKEFVSIRDLLGVS